MSKLASRLRFLLFPCQLLVLAMVVSSCDGQSKRRCYENLKAIDIAKDQWALENKKTRGTKVTTDDLLPYLRPWPKCPKGGEYKIGRVGETASCALASHKYP